MIREQLEALERKWREDAARLTKQAMPGDGLAATALRNCADDLRAILDGCAGEVEAVAWQCRFSDGNGGWTEWEQVTASSASFTVADRVAEIREYIANGYKYELRPLYTHPSAVVVDEDAQDAIDTLLSRMGDWSKAYPLDIFSAPTDAEREWLHATKPGLMDRIAASMGRHMATCIAEDLAALTAALQRDRQP